MSTNTQAISDEVNAAKMRFDAACRDWGWQADQGYDANAISASNIEYRAASDALSAAIAKALHEAHLSGRAEGVRETDEARIFGDHPSPWDEIARSWEAEG